MATIAIGGLHGTGKSTYAKALAEALALRHISAGQFFRRMAEERRMGLEELSREAARDSNIDLMIDGMVKREAAAGGVVVDGMLSAWMAQGADVKIFLTAPEEIRLKRIAARDGISLEDATRLTKLREELERERYRRYYGLDMDDLSVYDVIFDTSLYPIDVVRRAIIEAVAQFLRAKGRSAGPVDRR